MACGRRREIHPEHSVFNRLCDDEWNTPLGETPACGGDMLGRWEALDGIGGYNGTLIAGEEPDLCLRLRVAGWKIWRLDAEMTAHDADILRIGQWWKRVSRAGHAFAEGAFLHGKEHGHWVNETRRLLIWGLALPVLALMTLLLGGWWGLLVLGLYPLQVLRLARSRGIGKRFSWEWAFFLTLGKIPEALGALRFYRSRLTSRRSELIEYK